jgi:hypothetical protein
MPSRKRVGFQVFTLVLLAAGIVPLIVGYAIIAGVEPKVYLLEQDPQPFWTLFAISVAQFGLYLGWILRPHPVMYIICFVFSQLNLIFCGAVTFLSGLYSFAPRCSKDDPQCGAAITVFSASLILGVANIMLQYTNVHGGRINLARYK